MNHTVYFDSTMSDDARRREVYGGQLFVFSKRDSVLRLARFARELIEAALAPLAPETAQYELPVEKFAEILVRAQAAVHPPPGCQASRSGRSQRFGLRSRKDLLRPAKAAQLNQ